MGDVPKEHSRRPKRRSKSIRVRWTRSFASLKSWSTLATAMATRRRLNAVSRWSKEVLNSGAPTASALMVMAKINLAQQKVDEAIEGLRAALELEPANPQAHFVLGTALSVKGEGTAARTELARALEIDPGMLEARRILARVHASLGEHEYAVEEGAKLPGGETPNSIADANPTRHRAW